MPKQKYEYKQDDVIRVGEEIESYRNTSNIGHYGVWARKFDTANGAMGPWVLVSEITDSIHSAKETWDYFADHLRGEGALTGVFVNVLNWSETEPQYRNIGKYNCRSVALDVRSSNMLKGNGGVTRRTAPDAHDLHMAINRDFGDWLDSQDQSQDDAAKDIGHDTATGTEPPKESDISDRLADPTHDIPNGDTGSAFEAEQNAQHTESQSGGTVEHGASGRKSRKRKGDAA